MITVAVADNPALTRASSPAGPRDAESRDDGRRLARIEILAPVSIVVPTFREADNLPALISRVAALRDTYNLDLELLVMDDDSRDGSVEIVENSGHNWVRMVVRTNDRGLSASVVDGLRRARHPVVVCMDADLSHPPEKIPGMILALESGQQFVIGSRYVPGGSTDHDWGIFRWLNSRVATLLARPLTGAKDPMSGFFAMRKGDFERGAASLNPIGYKIALELIVKCGVENVGEVPIHFTDRVRGQSKLNLTEQLRYVQHLRRLYVHKFGMAMDFLQFLAVGASGLVVNLLVLSLLLALSTPEWLALAGGIGVSLISNFLLNRRFTFSYARQGNSWTQLAGFVGASAVGIVVNYVVSLSLLNAFLRDRPLGVQTAAMAGIAAGMLFNFLGNRFVVFKRRYTTTTRGVMPQLSRTMTPATDVRPSSRPAGVAWSLVGLFPALALTLAVFLVPAPPFPDVPFHLASAAIRADYDAVSAYRDYYVLSNDFGPNSMFHGLAVGSGRPLWATPALIGLSLLGTAGLVLLLARQHRTGPLFPLAAGLFVMNYSLAYGFVEFSLGVPLLLLLVWHLGREPISRSLWPIAFWAGGIALLLLATFFAHAILCIFCLCVVGLFAVLVFPRARSLSLAASAAAAPTIAAVAAWKLSRDSDPGGPGWLIFYYFREYLPQFPRRLADVLTLDHDSLVSPTLGPWVAATFGAMAVATAAACLLAPRRDADDKPVTAPPRTAVYALVGTSLAVVLLAPPGYPPFWSVYQRFTFVLMIALTLLSGARAGQAFAPRGLVYALAAANMTMGLLWAEHVVSFGRVAGDLTALAKQTHPTGVGAYVVAETGYRGEAEALVHAANLVTAFAQLPAQSELYDFPFARVRRGPALSDPIPRGSAHYDDVAALLPDLNGFGWVLVHGSVPDADRANLARRVPLLGRRGDWTIYGRRVRSEE